MEELSLTQKAIIFQAPVSAIRIVFIFLYFFVTGCTKHHQIFLDPSLPIHDSEIGNKTPVSLYVEDYRRNNIIAKWKKGLRKFSIFSQHDLKEIFSTKIQQGLTKLGFNPKIHRKYPNHFLNVQILDIKSKYNEKLPRMDIRVKAKLRATCRNNGKKYSKIYSAQKNHSDITPATFPNENLINAALSEILGRMFTDQALIACLIS
tara:strand:+ start:529 stop:1143 length:615 start_codon:yes stop_codon:yes gene_type:complete